MNEIEDLKNHILALQSKLNDLVRMAQISSQNNDKSNEILHLIHNMGFEREKTNAVLFESIYPDIITRLRDLELFVKSDSDVQYKKGDSFDVNFKVGRKKATKIHVYVRDNGFTFYVADKHYSYNFDI